MSVTTKIIAVVTTWSVLGLIVWIGITFPLLGMFLLGAQVQATVSYLVVSTKEQRQAMWSYLAMFYLGRGL